MNIPDIVVEWGLGVVSAVGGAGFWFLKSKSGENAKAISNLEDKLDADCSIMDKKILDAIEKMGEKMIPKTHCDSRQELYQVNFEHLMESNRSQHEDIKHGVARDSASTGKQFEILFEKMEDIKECLTQIQLNKEC